MTNFIKKYDVLTKILALAVAITLWAYVMEIKNPAKTVSFSDIPIEFSGLSTKEDGTKLVITQGENSKAIIKVKGFNSQILRLTSKDIIIVSDLSNINQKGEYLVDYTVKLGVSNLEVSDKTPKQVAITVDEITTKDIDVKTQILGTPLPGYSFENNQKLSKISITGPSTLIDSVKNAKVSVDITDKSSEINSSYQIKLIDNNDKEIINDNIVKSQERIKVKITPTFEKDVSLLVNLKYSNTVNEKTILGYTLSKNTVRISGLYEDVEKINSINLGDIFIDEKTTSDTVFELNLPEISNITYINSGKITVNITFSSYTIAEYIVSNIIIPSNITNISIITTQISVKIGGLEEDLEELTSENISITPIFDINQLTPGTHEVNCKINIENADLYDIIGEYKIVMEVK